MNATQRIAAIVEFLRRCHHQQGPQRHNHQLEQGRGANLWLYGRRGHRQPITILIPPDRQDEEAAIIERIRRGERIEHYETVRKRKHGSLIDISLTVSPIRNAQGKIIGASKIARDITERKQSSPD